MAIALWQCQLACLPLQLTRHHAIFKKLRLVSECRCSLTKGGTSSRGRSGISHLLWCCRCSGNISVHKRECIPLVEVSEFCRFGDVLCFLLSCFVIAIFADSARWHASLVQSRAWRFAKSTNCMRNSLKTYLSFQGDFEGTNPSKKLRNESQGIFFCSNFVSGGI